MDDEIQGGLVRKFEVIVKASQEIIGGRAREVKVSPGGIITVIMNDERRISHCMGEFPMFLEDPESVANLNISLKTKLRDSELETGKYIRQMADKEKNNMILREEMADIEKII